MTCQEFLARHSDFLDEELGAEGAVEMRLHLSACERCARYDRVLRRGLALVRDLEPVLPSADPYAALQQHLERSRFWSGRGAASGRPRAPLATGLAVAGVMALLAGGALFQGAPGPGHDSPSGASETVATGPARQLWADPLSAGMNVVAPGLPVVWRWPHAAPPARRRGSPTLAPLVMPRASVLDPGPYTPLVVQPPDYGQPMALPVLDTYTR